MVRHKETINSHLQATGLAEYAAVTLGIADKITQKLDAKIIIYGTIEKAGENIIVIGGGLIVCETALWLRQQGKNITIGSITRDNGRGRRDVLRKL